MNRLYTVLACCIALGAKAQPMISNGFPSMALINGTTYQKTSTLGTSNYSFVAGSNNGKFYAGRAFGSNTVYMINAATGAFIDSMSVPSDAGEMSAYNEPNTLFEVRGTALYRINTTAKTYDSIAIGNPFRAEERPGAKEVWVTADSMIHVVSYASGLSKSTIDISSNIYDNADVRFTKGGSIAYKSAGSNKKIYKIDANTKQVVDSINTAPYSHFVIEVSTDSSKIYASNNKAVLIYDIATKILVDSFVSNKQIMNLYRHPSRSELWAVHHFNDSVTVFNESTKATIASFGISSSPFFLGFSDGTVGINNMNTPSAVNIYPNPAKDKLYIDVHQQAQVVVYDLLGAKQGVYNISERNNDINIDSLVTGMYIIYIQLPNVEQQRAVFNKE